MSNYRYDEEVDVLHIGAHKNTYGEPLQGFEGSVILLKDPETDEIVGVRILQVKEFLEKPDPNDFTKIEIEREDDGRWVAEMPEQPGVTGYGTDPDEALKNMNSSWEMTLEDRQRHPVWWAEDVARRAEEEKKRHGEDCGGFTVQD